MFTVHLRINVSNSLPTNGLFSFIYCIFSTLLHVSVPLGHPQGVLTVNDQTLTQYGICLYKIVRLSHVIKFKNYKSYKM